LNQLQPKVVGFSALIKFELLLLGMNASAMLHIAGLRHKGT
jgi:hypothetical protein